MLRESPQRAEVLPAAHCALAALTRPAAADESAASGPPSPAGRGQVFNRENSGACIPLAPSDKSSERSRQLIENKDRSFSEIPESRQLAENTAVSQSKAVNRLKVKLVSSS